MMLSIGTMMSRGGAPQVASCFTGTTSDPNTPGDFHRLFEVNSKDMILISVRVAKISAARPQGQPFCHDDELSAMPLDS
jgi:hypothetical protein